MCSKVKVDGLRTKWILVALGVINATSLSIYLLIQILTSGSYLSTNRDEAQLAENSGSSTRSNVGLGAKNSSMFGLSETPDAHPYKAKIKFDDYEFEFILRELTFGEVHTLGKDEYSVVHTCGYSLLNKDQLRRAEQ